MGIDPDISDIGRQVIRREYLSGPVEVGVITSFNDAWVFVKYGTNVFSRPTAREELEFQGRKCE